MNKFKFFDDPFPDLQNLDIRGKRVRLASISSVYTQEIYQEFTSEVTRYMFPKPPERVEETQEFINNSLKSMRNGNNLVLVILLAQTDEFLGCCGLHGQKNVRLPELGIWLKVDAHGQRFGREAITTLVNWASENIELEGFIYPVDRENIASRKIPESLGGQVFKEAQVTSLSGYVLDEVVYKIPV